MVDKKVKAKVQASRDQRAARWTEPFGMRSKKRCSTSVAPTYDQLARRRATSRKVKVTLAPMPWDK
jgi:hypothetical protein